MFKFYTSAVFHRKKVFLVNSLKEQYTLKIPLCVEGSSNMKSQAIVNTKLCFVVIKF